MENQNQSPDFSPSASKLLLIDQDENMCRVAILQNGLLEDFDYEMAHQKLTKGNIYWAKVMRVESSLQAVFVDYGQEKQGFLAFSEIHPDLYQLTERKKRKIAQKNAEAEKKEAEKKEPLEEISEAPLLDENDEEVSSRIIPDPNVRLQDVISRGQEFLVQVSKDPRGNKGAALTTYISLPGRYSVFMPNTPGGGGVSKKITAASDRSALKEIMKSFGIPEGGSLIIRTTGLGRKKTELEKDYKQLTQTWESIKSQNQPVPGLVYEEQDLMTRALRDLYRTDVSAIIVEGQALYKQAKRLMKVFLPSHTKRIQLYTPDEKAPYETLFQHFGIEKEISAIYDHTLTLPSGGSIVITPTEALVSIDVNSAKATQEKSIEETALKTNLEAVATIARHLRLRDLSGLIVIDFIDMTQKRRELVEKAMKEAMKNDRARTKIGKISSFGLLELSRQRLRQSLLESTTRSCPTCLGSGRIWTKNITCVEILRQLKRQLFTHPFSILHQKSEDVLEKKPEKIREKLPLIEIHGHPEDIIELLNTCRQTLSELEKIHQVRLHAVTDPLISLGKIHLKEEVPSTQTPSHPQGHSVQKLPQGHHKKAKKENNRPKKSWIEKKAAPTAEEDISPLDNLESQSDEKEVSILKDTRISETEIQEPQAPEASPSRSARRRQRRKARLFAQKQPKEELINEAASKKNAGDLEEVQEHPLPARQKSKGKPSSGTLMPPMTPRIKGKKVNPKISLAKEKVAHTLSNPLGFSLEVSSSAPLAPIIPLPPRHKKNTTHGNAFQIILFPPEQKAGPGQDQHNGAKPDIPQEAMPQNEGRAKRAPLPPSEGLKKNRRKKTPPDLKPPPYQNPIPSVHHEAKEGASSPLGEAPSPQKPAALKKLKKSPSAGKKAAPLNPTQSNAVEPNDLIKENQREKETHTHKHQEEQKPSSIKSSSVRKKRGPRSENQKDSPPSETAAALPQITPSLAEMLPPLKKPGRKKKTSDPR